MATTSQSFPQLPADDKREPAVGVREVVPIGRARSVLDLIGNTPLLEIRRLTAGLLNPGVAPFEVFDHRLDRRAVGGDFVDTGGESAKWGWYSDPYWHGLEVTSCLNSYSYAGRIVQTRPRFVLCDEIERKASCLLSLRSGVRPCSHRDRRDKYAKAVPHAHIA